MTFPLLSLITFPSLSRLGTGFSIILPLESRLYTSLVFLEVFPSVETSVVLIENRVSYASLSHFLSQSLNSIAFFLLSAILPLIVASATAAVITAVVAPAISAAFFNFFSCFSMAASILPFKLLGSTFPFLIISIILSKSSFSSLKDLILFKFKVPSLTANSVSFLNSGCSFNNFFNFCSFEL